MLSGPANWLNVSVCRRLPTPEPASLPTAGLRKVPVCRLARRSGSHLPANDRPGAAAPGRFSFDTIRRMSSRILWAIVGGFLAGVFVRSFIALPWPVAAFFVLLPVASLASLSFVLGKKNELL